MTTRVILNKCNKFVALLSTDVGLVEGIVFEPSEKWLFWTCNSNATINKLKLAGNVTKSEIVVRLSTQDKPRGIDVDSCEM